MSEAIPSPMKRCSPPAYPTKLEVLSDRRLLATNMPPNWVSRAEVAGLAAAFLVAGADGCSRKSTSLGPNDPAIVAPIFEHGEGRGATGCVVTAPPVFLSEEEALEVIREELMASVPGRWRTNVQVASVQLPTRKKTVKRNWVTGKDALGFADDTSVNLPFEVDLVNQDGHITVEFVSKTDCRNCGSDLVFGSSGRVDVKETARWFSHHIEEQAQGMVVGMLYDPLLKTDREVKLRDPNRRERWQRQDGVVREECKLLLRQQVRDFVEWLKGQGVI